MNVSGAHLGAIYRDHGGELPLVARAGLRAGAEKGKTRVIRRTPVGITPGLMRLSWAVFPWGKLGWRLDNSAPHAGIVEAGARPHPVSREGVEAIREWVARVLPLVEKRGGAGTRKATAAEFATGEALRRHSGRDDGLTRKQRKLRDLGRLIDSITWAIVHKLKTEGQKPKWVVRAIIAELGRIAQAEVSAAVAAYLARRPVGA